MERDAMDAIKLLKACHYQIRDLLEDLCDAGTQAGQVRSDLLAQVTQELEVHARLENGIFYPAFEGVATRDEDLRLVHEAREENRAAVELLLPDLNDTDIDSEQFCGRVKVLACVVEQHIRDEEHELFARARKLMPEVERDRLGERLLQCKQALFGEALAS